MPSVLSPPPRHPGRVAVRGRGGRVGLEAQLLRRLGDAIHQEVLIPVVAVLAHDRAELRQLAIQDPRDRIPPKHHDLVDMRNQRMASEPYPVIGFLLNTTILYSP